MHGTFSNHINRLTRMKLRMTLVRNRSDLSPCTTTLRAKFSSGSPLHVSVLSLQTAKGIRPLHAGFRPNIQYMNDFDRVCVFVASVHVYICPLPCMQTRISNRTGEGMLVDLRGHIRYCQYHGGLGS